MEAFKGKTHGKPSKIIYRWRTTFRPADDCILQMEDVVRVVPMHIYGLDRIRNSDEKIEDIIYVFFQVSTQMNGTSLFPLKGNNNPNEPLVLDQFILGQGVFHVSETGLQSSTSFTFTGPMFNSKPKMYIIYRISLLPVDFEICCFSLPNLVPKITGWWFQL